MNSKNFDRIETQIEGLGGVYDIQKLYAEHTQAAINAENTAAEETTAAETKAN